MANKVQFIVEAIDNASKTMKGISSNISKEIWKTEKSFNSFWETMRKNQQWFQTIWIASWIAFWAFSVWAKKATDDAIELQNSLKGLQSIVEGTWNDFSKAQTFIDEFTKDWLMSTAEAATSLKNLLAKWFNLKEASDLMYRFKDAAAFWRQSALTLWEAVKWATEGIKNENSALVDNAWVTKNVAAMMEDYAKSIGKSYKELTEAEKRTAVYNWVLEETKFQTGDAAKLTEWYGWQVAKLETAKLKLSQTVGTILIPVLTKLVEKITPIIESITKWTKDHPKLTQYIILWTIAITWITTALVWLWFIIPSIIISLKALGATFMFLAANPIGLMITAIWLLVAAWIWLYKNWDKVKLNVWWGLHFMAEDFRKWFKIIWKYLYDFFPNLRAWFNILVEEAKEWWKNLVKMFIWWLTDMFPDFVAGVKNLASTIADYLWFHSPTKEGPAKDSDKWMPNFISMLSQWLRDWEAIITQRAIELSTALWEWMRKNLWIEKIKTTLSSLKWVFSDVFSSLWSEIDNSKSKIQSLKDEIQSLKSKFSDLWKQSISVEEEWKSWLATKAIELEQQIQDLKNQWALQEDIRKKEEELWLAKQFITEQDIINARTELWKSETQKMVDNLRTKLQAIQDERTEVQVQLQEKIKALSDEEIAYKALNDKRIEFENQYYTLFQEHIQGVKTWIGQAISLMAKLNSMKWGGSSGSGASTWISAARATGWPVEKNKIYKVWEKWEELFVPNTSGRIIPNDKLGNSWNPININIGFGWVNVNNQWDAEYLAEQVKNKIIRELQLYKLWIS